MDLLETILNQQNGAAVRQIESQFGLEPEQTRSALAALVPALAAGLQRNAQSPDGLQDLLAALSSGGHEEYVETQQTLELPETIEDGNGPVARLRQQGSRRQVAHARGGPDRPRCQTVERMLPMVET